MTDAVSFAASILPLFRTIDIDHMEPFGVLLNDYAYMSDPAGDHANAHAVHASLSEGAATRMPPNGPYWTQEQLELFAAWMSGGYKP